MFGLLIFRNGTVVQRRFGQDKAADPRLKSLRYRLVRGPWS